MPASRLPPRPGDDASSVAELLRHSGLLGDEAQEAAFDRFTALAARLLQVPIVAASLLDKERLRVKSAQGLSQRELPLSQSFCQYVLRSGLPLLVDDVRGWPQLGELPLVRECGAQAYLGVPLFTGGGIAVGTLCVLDTRPRPWNAQDQELLEVLAAAVMREIDSRLARQTDAALRQSNRRFRQIFEHAAMGIAIADLDGRLVQCNPACAAMLGYAPYELEQLRFADLVHPDDRADNQAHVQDLVQRGDGFFEIENRYVHRSGETVWVHKYVSLLRDEDGRPLHSFALVTDVTQARRAQQRLALQHSVSQVLMHADGFDAALPHLLQALSAGLNAEFCALWLPLPDGSALRCAGHLVAAGESARLASFTATTQELTLTPGLGLPGRVWQSGQPLWLESLVHDSSISLLRPAAACGLRSGVAVPLPGDGRCLGVIEWFTHEVMRRDDELLAALGSLGSEVGQFLQRCKVEERLRESEARLKGLVESAMDAVIAIDKAQRIVLFNPAAQRMFGLSAGEALGSPLDRLIPQGARSSHRAHVEAFARSGVSERGMGARSDLHGLRADGSEFPLEATISRMRSNGQTFMTVIVRDITERRRAEEALRDADRRKDEFLAVLAHELRNPLAPMRNALELMKRAPQQAGPALATIERQLAHMVRLVDDLLDVSRISRNRLELRRTRVELAAVVNVAVEACRPLCEQLNQELTVTLPAQPLWLDADPVRLAQAFSNLLTNASKYTPAGGRIWLRAQHEDGALLVQVRDTGLGIPAGMLSRVFELFTQVDRSLERSAGGLGIGLSLVRRLVELHGGTVSAHSEGPGRGSEFTVRLPLPAQPLPDAPPAPAARTTATGVGRRRILVVDDNVDSAQTLAMLLELSGHETRLAHDGVAAVEAAVQFRPDLILLDLGLPRLNGYDACRRIREQSWSKSTRIVAITGWGQDEDRRRSREAGFDAHLVKPVEPAALAALLEAAP